MSDYVTVVSVDGAENVSQCHVPENDNNTPVAINGDSQFITVLSINDTTKNVSSLKPAASPEEVLVYRLPGERLGFGLKFQGGTRNAENIQKLFIQSCAGDSPASRATTSWGTLREGDEIIKIDGINVNEMTRLECVKCLKESNLAIRLLVRNGEGKAYYQNDVIEIKADKKSIPPLPPPVPPRKINKRKSSVEKVSNAKVVASSSNGTVDKPFTPPPDAEFYINLFSGKF